MAEEGKNSADAAPSGAKGPKGPMILALVNTLAVLAVLGTLVYTRVLYKRPAITEETERARLTEAHASPKAPTEPGRMTFEPVTVNIQASANAPQKSKDGGPSKAPASGKMHYVTLGFTLELADKELEAQLDSVRPVLMDQILAIVGKKPFHELSHVQGRYILRNEILEAANTVARRDHPTQENLVTNVYFTHFIVQ